MPLEVLEELRLHETPVLLAAWHVPLVRERWADLQAALFESGYRVAAEGRRLLDRGEGDAAERLLTEYMAGHLETTLRMAREMVGELETG